MKIVTIGGGSSYTPELIEGFILRADEMPIKEIWLVDIEAGKEKLEIVGAMAKRMIKAANLDWKVYLTLDRKEALKDADFVTTQFRVGLLDARIKDERIPNKYGMISQETNGAGGIFKAFRTIPVILDIIEDMKEFCPNAWLVNFTNPAGMVTEAAIKVGGWEKTVGLCNVPIVHQKINQTVLDSKDVIQRFAGLNHFHWHRVWDKKGNELTNTIIEKLYNPEVELTKEMQAMKNVSDFKFLFPHLKDLGMLPCAYHRYYYITETMLNEELENYKQNQTRAEVVKQTETELFELYKDPNLDHKPEQLTQRGGTYYSDAACEIINSIWNDKRTEMVVSTLNKHALSDLPYDSVVEVSSIIGAKGPEPLTWGKLPSGARGQIQILKAMEETVIKAAISGDYNTALHAFVLNPLITSGDTAVELLNELLVAHKEHLPQFKEAIKNL
ncbi:MAG TPA: 6-phospho-beta-glucosidase [Erysipelothrix sp.]|nr:6-phospho-beta-glucosidase [Erysipelothrix sp.]